jgi:hypothetical protein
MDLSFKLLSNNRETTQRQVGMQDVAHEEQDANSVPYQLTDHTDVETF